MRWTDFVREEGEGKDVGVIDDGAVNLITTLELLRHRYKGSDQDPVIQTNSLINMIRNTDQNFDYNALVAANDNPAVQNLIKSFNTDEVIINLDDPTVDQDQDVNNDEPGQGNPEIPVDDVSSMAKRAAKKRGAPMSEDEGQNEELYLVRSLKEKRCEKNS